jgi:excinuclease ABC subunit B
MVIFYADNITDSMRRTIEETNRRRSTQMSYNETHGITPTTVFKSREEILNQQSILDIRGPKSAYVEPEKPSIAADPVIGYMGREQLEKLIAETERKMKQAAKELDFISAAQYRDELFALKDKLKHQ